jgi:hypothetical protein
MPLSSSRFEESEDLRIWESARRIREYVEWGLMVHTQEPSDPLRYQKIREVLKRNEKVKNGS